MSRVEALLSELGLSLPEAPKPVAAYVPTVRTGNLVFISGQGPVRDGKPVWAGRVGEDLSLEDGYEASRLTCLNALAQLKAEIGSLDQVIKIVKVTGWVNSAPNFDQQPKVINGASDLLEKLFTKRGKHARSAISAHVLPRNIAVEIEMIVEVN